MPNKQIQTADESHDCSTMEVARMLGLAVRSVQLMVDRGELVAWKTPGGHRRISRSSVEAWTAQRMNGASASRTERSARAEWAAPALPPRTKASRNAPPSGAPRMLLIEDSVHFQNLVSLLVGQQFPSLELHVAHDGIVGLAMCGNLLPDVLIVDILLPGIDGATLITSLRSQPQFAQSKLIVVTSLSEAERAPYAFALEGVPVIHKPNLVRDLPGLLREALAEAGYPAEPLA
ncbi:helix-turn-helix domain-containing protein [Roseateles koreensis]|uniref:Response regulator n=1 Tax=Roseateles koreensis TaxID=2987526 RepID=A0ABT5KRH5_9BURK|nr:helix-turn-helix domain-containing protein [Roseateles koreensis]MDC8784973.1 response regulator [Roseateles koreensis]